MKKAKLVAIWSIVISLVMFVFSIVLWLAAMKFKWLDSVAFVSHVSMLALVFAAISAAFSSLAAYFAEESSES